MGKQKPLDSNIIDKQTFWLICRDSGFGHGRCCRLSRVLYEGAPAMLLDFDKPRRAIITGTAENNARDLLSVGDGNGSEQGVNCRTRVVNFRPLIQPNQPRLDPHMKVRWCNVDSSWLDTLTVARELHAELAMPAQYLRQQAVGTGMHDDKQRRIAIAWEWFSDASERSEAAARSANRNDRVRDHRDSCDRRSFQLDNVCGDRVARLRATLFILPKSVAELHK
jgi:hypothetical protein